MFHMKHKNVAVIDSSDLAGLLIIGCLSRRPIEAFGGLVVAEMSRPAELGNLRQLIEIELVKNIHTLGIRFIEESRITPWPKDNLLVKRKMLNTKGFRRKEINPGRR